MIKTPSYYRTLPYSRRVELIEEEDGERYFVARIEEIPWINIDGQTRVEALKRLDEIFDDCIQAMIDKGDHVPEPNRWPLSVDYEPRSASLFTKHASGPSRNAVQLEDLPEFTPIAQPSEVVVG